MALLTSISAGLTALSSANSDITCYVYGDTYATYKIELFEVGNPYPSRQNVGTGTTFSPQWWSLVTSPRYFVRITKNGVARQTASFSIRDGLRQPNGWIKVKWTSSGLTLSLSW